MKRRMSHKEVNHTTITNKNSELRISYETHSEWNTFYEDFLIKEASSLGRSKK